MDRSYALQLCLEQTRGHRGKEVLHFGEIPWKHRRREALRRKPGLGVYHAYGAATQMLTATPTSTPALTCRACLSGQNSIEYFMPTIRHQSESVLIEMEKASDIHFISALADEYSEVLGISNIILERCAWPALPTA